MKCKNCNTNLLPEYKFCGICGLKIIKINECPSCKEENNPEFKFCAYCGEQLSTSQEKPTAIKEQKIKSEQRQYEGERKLVTVIFADICGFTTLSESHDAEEVMNIINSCFERLVRIIYSYEGYVDKYMGDCIMALFGVPVAHENDSQRAVQSALLMIEELNEFNKNSDIPLGISIGINTGEAVADYMGGEMKKEYTVIGDTVNVAQRLQSKAERNQILISHSVYIACKDNFEINPLAPIALKGKTEKVRCYEVKGVKSKKSSITEQSQKLLIGREQEVEKIKNIINAVTSNSAYLLNIVGDGGSGKSHLKYFILEHCYVHSEKFHWLDASCETYTQNILLGLFASLIRDVGKIKSKNPLFAEKINSINAKVTVKEGIHKIKETLAIWFDDTNMDSYDEETLKKIIFVYIKELFSEIAKDSPTIIIIEDIQWADSTSLELVNFLLVEIKPELAVFFVITQRPDFHHNFNSKIKEERIELKPFNREDTNSLIKTFLPCDYIPNDFIDAVYNKTQGNPLYVEEIIKSFIDKGYIFERDGKWHFEKTVKIEIPSTIVETIQARIDNLVSTKKRVLQYSSVIGMEFKYEHLKRLYGGEDLKDILVDLEQSQIVQKVGRSSELEYSFKHAIVLEVVYGTILKKRVSTIHNEYAKILESLTDSNIYEYYEILAHHYSQGESWQTAFKYLIESFKKHIKIYDHEGASLFLLKAIEISKKYMNCDRLLLLISELSECYEKIGKTDDAKKLLDESEQVEGNRTEKSKFHSERGRILRVKGLFKESLSEFDRAISFTDDLLRRLDIAREKATTLQRTGDYEEALKILTEGLIYFTKYPESMIEAKYLNNLGILYTNLGKHKDAFASLKRSLEIREHLNDLWGVSVVLSNIIFLSIDNEQTEDIWEYYAKYKELSKKIGDKVGMAYIKHNMGCMHYFLKDYKKADNFLLDVSNIANDVNDVRLISSNNIFYGANLFYMGEREKGQNILDKNLKMAEEIGCVEGMFWGYLLMGEIEEAKSMRDSAISSYKNAESIAIKMNNKQYIEKVNLRLQNL